MLGLGARGYCRLAGWAVSPRGTKDLSLIDGQVWSDTQEAAATCGSLLCASETVGKGQVVSVARNDQGLLTGTERRLANDCLSNGAVNVSTRNEDQEGDNHLSRKEQRVAGVIFPKTVSVFLGTLTGKKGKTVINE